MLAPHLAPAKIYADETGAVTVDWVALTAAIVAMGMIVGGIIWGPSNNASEKVRDFISTQEVKTTF
ncbi:hypothetical protein BFP70_07175 [Thioclava sp. SK-1]|uniref:hypothetical protein n=1 Tax=Thioclava sp. SK-1 TaxID=1889770 RepID=UPI0008249903|nr:hypothetical protein [Thioclava sp. SK-1]OCX65907.1 hypothetical protein BFP70_07175 [Thioclava sp. SK-1]